MKVQNYIRVSSLEEAHELLQKSPRNKILGGGLWLKKGNAEVETLIDLSKLGLDQINDFDNYVEVGAMVTQRTFEKSPLIERIGGGVLCEAVHQILGPAFRETATIGGSVYGKYGFSDVVTALLAFKVELVFYPEQIISLDEYVSKPTFGEGILTHIRIYKSNAKAFFKKVKMTALDYPMLNVCITKDKEYKIVVGARPLVAKVMSETMEYLKQGGLDFAHAAEIAAEEAMLSDSINIKQDYRKQLVLTYVKRGLEEVQ